MNYIKLLTIITFAIFISACSNNNDANDNSNTDQAQSENVETNPNVDNEAIEKYDFRRTKWGMSMAEVKEREDTEPVLESENTLDYSIIMLGQQTQIGYTFAEDKLIRAGFFFLTKPDTNNEYVESYQEIKEELIKVNGEPVIDTEQPRDLTKTFAPEEKGDAACSGELLLAAQWDLPDTDIQLVLRGEESECKLTVLYISDEGLKQLLQERANQK